jgi:hypothetical protein
MIRLWVCILHQYRLVNSNKYTNAVGDADNGDGYACGGLYRNSLYLPLNLAVNLKLLQKKNNILKKKKFTMWVNRWMDCISN